MREIQHGIAYPERAPKSRKSPRGFLPPGPELRAAHHGPVTACCAMTTRGIAIPFLSVEAPGPASPYRHIGSQLSGLQHHATTKKRHASLRPGTALLLVAMLSTAVPWPDIT
jgi:hypothetical protein